MWKRLWKNVILVLCVLAMVFQPVICFASSSYTYNNISALIDNWHHSIGDELSHYVSIYSVDNPDWNMYEYCLLLGFSFLENRDYIYTVRTTELGNGLLNMHFRAIPSSTWTLSRNVNLGSVYFYANQNTYAYISNFTVDPNDFRNSIDEGLDPEYSSYNAGNFFYITANGVGGYISSTYLDVPNNYTLSSYPNRRPTSSIYTPVYYFVYNTGSGTQYNPELPSGNVLPPTEPDVNNEMFYWFMNSNFYYRDGQSALNQDYAPIGLCLTYDYLAKTHADEQYITIGGVQYDNWYYELTSMFGSLALQSLTLNSIKNKLDDAFPEDQAEMNDAIADQILDNSNDNGLTVNRVTSAKSDLDDGLDTFKLDTSQSQYSNPFSALDDADWSFWSQTTLNNLGSGYSYSFDEGSLMSEDDVFTENQNDLLNLLGW